MNEEPEEPTTALELTRRWLAWLCVSAFVGSFAGLLLLSATSYWTPENSWIAVLDAAWRASLVFGALLWLIPRIGNGARWLGELFGGKTEGA